MTYVEELKESFFIDDLGGNTFRVNGAKVVEEIRTQKGITYTYAIKDSIMRILSAKRVKKYSDALLVVKHQYEIGFIDLDTAVSTTVIIYLNEMSRRCEIKTPIVISLLNRAAFSIMDIPAVITNLDASIERQTNKAVG